MRLAPVGNSVNQNRSGAGLGSGKGEGSGRGSGTGAGAGSGIGFGLGTRGSESVIMVVASFRRLQALRRPDNGVPNRGQASEIFALTPVCRV